MLRKMNHKGPLARMMLRRRTAERGMSRTFVGVLAAIGVVGLAIFMSELPSLRRYMRIRAM